MTPDRNLKCVWWDDVENKIKNYHASEGSLSHSILFNHTNNICRPLCYKNLYYTYDEYTKENEPFIH